MTPSITSFFQIIINSTIQEGKLKFPNKFVHEHGNELYNTVKLSIPTGSCWDVIVKREANGTIWLHDGFLEFMEENSIGIEYFLIFKYDGNSKFIVHIYDLTATEILYNRSSDSDRCDFKKELQMDESEKDRDDFKYESGDKDSDDRADDSLNEESVYRISDDDRDDSFRSESNDEEADDHGDDSFSYESNDKDSNNGRVDAPKYENGDKDSDDSSVECLGSTINHPSPQLFAEHSEFASKDEQNVGSSHETTRARRCYLTRRKRQMIEGSADGNRSMHNHSRDDGNNVSPGDIAKDTTRRAKKMQSTVPNSLQILMRPYHITKGLLRIPCAFARSYICCSTTHIKLVDSNNKEWEVHCVNSRGNYIICRGWRRFVLDKRLMVGDMCVFKRIESKSNGEVKLKVNILCEC